MKQQQRPARQSRWGLRTAADPAASRLTVPQTMADLETRLDRLVSSRASVELPISMSAGPATTGLQVRHFKAAAIAVRRSAGRGVGMVKGLCIPYGELVDLGGGRAEQFQFGAFRDSLATDDPRVFFNGNVDLVLGRAGAGTARFEERRDGLHYEADLPDTQFARDLQVSMERRDVSGSSCAFIVDKQETKQIDGKSVNVIIKARLVAASVSTFAMFQQANTDTESKIEAAFANGVRAGLLKAKKALEQKQQGARAQRQGARPAASLINPRAFAEYTRRLSAIQ